MEGAIVPSGQTVKATSILLMKIKDHDVIETLLSKIRLGLAACYNFHRYETCVLVCI